ncbi:hypothetical protein Spith_2164 [Spirochaeta thermophila DSM 6578]|uniref:4Fe-4S ferredoxin-type domain-containing protein n=1 Tax=Winmispira thermophila (strain ATCC 700085 / DSM 6578 / Z-1203) TaxID=869211 RepID=G0GFM0_WINT7|nr:ferredoxin [Spirochaeta thermophila]AEJ62419.1 hypothetical protein Spith_2164 [Spirochaeta thermophila DSM 6578]
MRVKVDTERCISCGLCEEMLPEVFKVEEKGASVLLPLIEEEDRKAVVWGLLEDCPGEALTVEGEEPRIIPFYVARPERR